MHREYNVIVHKGVDLAELEQELCSSFGSETIPDRPIEICDARPGSARITSFNLTDEEAEQLKNDPRILDVEIPPLQQDGMFVGRYVTNQSGNFQRGGSVATDLVNWGLRRGIETTNPYGGSTTVTGDYTYSRDGTGVDIVIMDSGIQADHPDFEDADGNSRVRQIDWYDAAGITGTMPANFYTDYEGHGTHCAGIAAGKTYGWAKNADIYAMKLNGLEGPTDPGVGISISQAFDLMRLWHIRKNDPNDPIYTGRPTVVNMSWGYNYQNASNPDSGVYRGTSWTYGVDYTTEAALWSGTGVVPRLNTSSGLRHILPGVSSTSDAETSDLVDAGVIVTISAGNNYYKNTLSGDTEYNNSATWGATTRYYHRKGSPWDDNAFYVGNIDQEQVLDTGNYLDVTSDSSTRGPAVNIWSPGTQIMSATSTTNDYGSSPVNYPANTSFRIVRISGTSMAAPQIAGIAALHLQANRDFGVADIRDRLLVQDSSNVMYTTGLEDDYTAYTRSLMGATGNVAYSRYYQDVAESLTNVTVSSPSVTTFINTAAEIDLRGNVSNIAATNLRSVTITSAPTNGTVEQTDPVLGTLIYTPNTDYNGADSFSYTVENTLGNVSNTGTVSIDVSSSVNLTLQDSVAETLQETSTLFDPIGDRANANVETIAITVAPIGGTAVAYSNGNITYSSNPGFYGKDNITFSVDNLDSTLTRTANIELYVNQQVAVSNFTANVDTSLGTALIPVLENSTSYDPHFANVKAIYNFSSGYNDSVGNLGDITPVGTSINLISSGSEHDLDGIYFGDDSNHTGASIAAANLATSSFFTSGDWTVEWSFWKDSGSTSATQSFICASGVNFGPLRCFINATNLTVLVGNGTGYLRNMQFITGHTFDAWNKVAIQRRGEAIDVFINGVLSVSSSSGSSLAGIAETDGTVYIGRDAFSTSTYKMNDCYMDNIRFTQGVARYSTDGYLVATQGFPTSNSELANVSTLTIARQPDNGTAVVDLANAAIEYQANEGYTGTDYLEYNVTSINPTTSGNGNVTISVTSSLVPTYNNVTVNTATINEDGSNAIFTVNTENVSDGTTVGYTLSGTGITVDDISLASLTGTITITSNVGLLDFNIVADNLTEGNETLVMQLDATDSNGDGTGSIGNVLIINDTSLNPVSYDTAAFNRISSDEDADSGSPTLVRFIVNTTSVTDGTTVGYYLTGLGISVDDISLGSLTGTITINSNTGSVDFYIEEDNLTEGNETLVAILDPTDSNGDSTGSLSDSIVLNDTSLDPGVYDSLTVSPTSINEDGSTVTFTVNTTGVVDGTTVNYQITGAGITVDDISLVSLNGTITITSNTGDLSFDINADSFTEGAETLTVTLDASDSQGDATGSLANSVIINDTSTSPVPGTPTYNTVTFDVTDVNEDGSVVAFDIFTTDVLDGTSVGWTISGTGITTDDISLGSLTGSTNIFSNTGALVFSVSEDYTTEGPETLTITLDPTDSNGNVTGNLSASVVINDTSLTPAYNSASFDVASIDENNTDVATFTVNTENVLDGTTVGYTITGTTVDQISLGSLTGTLTITGDTASFGFTAVEDNTTDGDSTVTVTLDATDSFGTSTGALSDTVDIIDTSLTPVIPPTATDTNVATNRATPVVIQVAPLINDPDGTIVTISTGVGSANNGTAIPTFISESNVFYTYTPDTEFAGNDIIRYFVTDNDGASSNTANINIQVYAAPTVVDDAVTLDENSSTTINVVSNDVAGDNAIDFGTVVIDSGPSDGVAVANSNGTITYTPTIGFFGNDTVSYTVADIVGGISLPGNVTFTVLENIVIPNIPPVANDDTAFVAINGSVLINVVANDTDTEGGLDISSVAITQAPANGNVVAYANGVVSYTPTIGFAGVDSFLYTVSDIDGGVSNNANVVVNVLNAPIAVDDNVTIERNTVASIFVPGNDIDPDGNIDVTTVQIISGPDFGYANVNSVTGNIDYTPWTNFVGTDTLQYTINDDTGITSGPGNVVITVEFPPPAGDDQISVRSTGGVGTVVTAPVNMLGDLIPKIAPEIDPDSRSLSFSYFYDNPKLLWSPNRTPQQKFMGYDPSAYPSTAAEHRIPIRYSDLVDYLWYFVPFPDPIINVSSIGNTTGYTNDGQTTVIEIPYSVNWRQSEWPVPPRIAPTNFRVDVRWYVDNTLIETQTNIGSSGVFRSPGIANGSTEVTRALKAEFHAYLRGPNDDNPQAPDYSTLKTYASSSKITTGTLSVETFEGAQPSIQMFPLLTETITVRITRYANGDYYSSSSERAWFGEGQDGLSISGVTYQFFPAPGRSPVNSEYLVWEVENPETGEWSDIPVYGGSEYSVKGFRWPAAFLPYDGKDGNPNYTGWAVRQKAEARQNLSNPTEQNYSGVGTSSGIPAGVNGEYMQFVAPGSQPKTFLNFITEELATEYTAQVRFPCLKGLDLAGRFLIKNAPATANYYWRIVPDGAHANEFSPTSGTLFNVAPGDPDELVIAGIYPTCAIGEIVDRPYILEVYADAGYTELLDSTNFITKYGVESLEFDSIARADKNGDYISARGIATGQTFDTREGTDCVLRIQGQNLQKYEGEYFYVSYNRTVADTTTATDLQYRLPGQATWTTVAPGTRFPAEITVAGLGFESEQYELDAIVFLRFIDDSPGGGEENNYEQFNLKLWEFSSGGSQADNFNLQVYDNYEYFLGIVDTLEVQNPTYTTTNGELTQSGSGYIKWTGATLGQSYGTFLGFSVYDSSTWGSAISNPGPYYEDLSFGGLYQWQYYYNGAWRALGEVYDPSGGAERNLNGDARCVQREDDYFEFKNIDSQVIGGINWANGVSVRCRYRTYYNFSSINSPGLVIETKYSNTVTLRITEDAQIQANGLTGVYAYGLDEGVSEQHFYSVFQEGVTGALVDVSVTNNHLFMSGATGYPKTELTDVRLVENRTNIDNGRLLPLARPVFTYYHDESVKETVTVTLQNPDLATGDGETTVSREFTIKNDAWDLKRVWAQSSSNTITTNTWQLNEGDSVRIGVELSNWPSEFNSAFGGGQFFIYDAYIGGVAIPDSEMSNYFDGLSTITSLGSGNPYTNTYYSTKQGGNFALTGQGNSGTVTGRQNYRYVGNFNIQTKLQPDNAGDLTFKVLAYGRTTGESTEALALGYAFPLGIGNGYMWTLDLNVTALNTTPQPWDPADGQINILGNNQTWPEGGLTKPNGQPNTVIPGHCYTWIHNRDSAGNATAPALTPVYYRLNTSLTTATLGTDFNDINGSFETKSNGAIQQLIPGLRTDGVAGVGIVYEIPDDGVEDGDKIIAFDFSYFSDFSSVTTGSFRIADVYVPPILDPVASAIPGDLESQWIYGFISPFEDYSDYGARASIRCDTDGLVRTIVNQNNGLTAQAVVRGRWIPEGGTGVASDYEGRIINFETDTPFYTGNLLTGGYGTTWQNMGSGSLNIGLDSSGTYSPRDVAPFANLRATFQLRKVGGGTIASKEVMIVIVVEP